MPDKTNKNLNQIGGVERPSEPSGIEKKEKGEDLKEHSREFIEGVSEVVEGAETAEIADGEVSERLKEGKKKAPAGGGGGKATASTAQVAIPELDVMVIQISTKIKKELFALEKEKKQIMRHPTKFDASKFNKVVARIRDLRDILANLAHETTEKLKDLWLTHVKGIKS